MSSTDKIIRLKTVLARTGLSRSTMYRKIAEGKPIAAMAFVARYPSADALLEMLADPAYRKAVIHRQAAVATSRLIRCGKRAAGRRFA